MSLKPTEIATLKRAAKILESLVVKNGDVLSSPEHVKRLIQCRIGHLEHEQFGVIFLSNRHHVIAIEDRVFTGDIASCSVYPRQVLKLALKHNCAACIIFHNHPSFSSAEPSDTDVRLVRKLTDALNLLDIRLLDSIVVSGSLSVSMAERGLM